MTGKHRILVIAHGHPDFAPGGGEIAAYGLYQTFLGRPDVEDAWFLARVEGVASGFIRPRRKGEYLWQQSTRNLFLLQGSQPLVSLEYFRRLLEELHPSVVFLHHVLHLGIEMIRVIRQCGWKVKIVLTLHEMLPICHHDGQMVRTGSMRLCREATPDDCHACFPEHSSAEFWLRKRYIQRNFEGVDHFVTPSEFLKTRYVGWGLDRQRISVIENGQPPCARIPPRALREGELRARFGFFGQINPYKGLDILLQAISLVPADLHGKLQLEIHGANLEAQAPEFRARLQAPLERLQAHGMLRWAGPYDREQLAGRMGGVDWVMVPSIWWENSPLVIQEAFSLGRPVICSGIGGMAEKVRDQVDGLHVEPGNPVAWAAAMATAAESPTLWERLSRNIGPRISLDEAADSYLSTARTKPSLVEKSAA